MARRLQRGRTGYVREGCWHEQRRIEARPAFPRRVRLRAARSSAAVMMPRSRNERAISQCAVRGRVSWSRSATPVVSARVRLIDCNIAVPRSVGSATASFVRSTRWLRRAAAVVARSPRTGGGGSKSVSSRRVVRRLELRHRGAQRTTEAEQRERGPRSAVSPASTRMRIDASLEPRSGPGRRGC